MRRTVRHTESVSRSDAPALSRNGGPRPHSSLPTARGFPMKRLVQTGVIALALVPASLAAFSSVIHVRTTGRLGTPSTPRPRTPPPWC